MLQQMLYGLFIYFIFISGPFTKYSRYHGFLEWFHGGTVTGYGIRKFEIANRKNMPFLTAENVRWSFINYNYIYSEQGKSHMSCIKFKCCARMMRNFATPCIRNSTRARKRNLIFEITAYNLRKKCYFYVMCWLKNVFFTNVIAILAALMKTPKLSSMLRCIYLFKRDETELLVFSHALHNLFFVS